MERFWQKLTGIAFNRSKDAPPEDTVESCHPLAFAGLSAKTITYIRKLAGERIDNISLYLTALTHRSVVHDPATENIIESNQRLEFLGDSVLGMIISEYLFRQFPASAEGELSSNRSKIVNRKSLAGFARSIDLGDHLLIGESADHNKIINSESALADAFESLIGAIYLDKGIAAASDFILKHVIEHVDFKRIVSSEHNYKSRLIEYTQSNRMPAPVYIVTEESGAEHEKTFTIAVSCSGQLLGTGTAPRKKDAEQLAAKEAMKHLAPGDETSPG
ncbi:MAG: ribonuclease III [Chlorobiaceae bacterium]|jgi:ribonuclease III|nr:ribonuclease III [Chlorobiaceae bacterium]